MKICGYSNTTFPDLSSEKISPEMLMSPCDMISILKNIPVINTSKDLRPTPLSK